MITSTQLLREIAADNPFQPATSIWRAVELALIINTPFPEGRGLDLGCGDGAILQRILNHIGPREVVGIDLDPRETEAAAALGLYTAVHTGPGSEIPEPDASFDFVFSNSVLEHIPDLSSVFAEVARVLKPGGKFYFTVPSTTFPDLLYGPWLPGADREAYNEMITRRIAVEHYFSIEQCSEWMLEAGMKLDETIPYFSRKVTRRWEFVARITSGILYQIVGMRKQPIEIQHSLKIRTRRGGVLAKLAVPAVMLLGTGALKDEDGPRHGYGGYRFIARKPGLLNANVLEIPPCPACTSETTRSWLSKNEYTHGRCDACGHGFLFPVPSQAEIDAYYQGLNSGLSSDASWQTEAGHKCQLWRRLLDGVERTSGRGPLLDLGCGGGQFLQLAAECGWTESSGVEPSPKAIAIARAAVSAPIHEGSWKEVSLQPTTFAAVALLDVLEHDTDPHGLLAHCFHLLRPGGSLIITVPNIHGLSIRCFGREAYVVIPPEHLSYFTAKSLRLLLLKAGFAPPRTFTCDLYLKEWLRFFTRIQKGAPVAREHADGKTQYLKWHHRLSGGIALRGIGAVNALLAILGCGDQLVAVAQKPFGSSGHA